MPRSNKSWRMRRKSNSIVPPPQRKYLHHFPERLTATGRPVHSAIKAELHYTTIAATSQPKFGRRGAAAEVDARNLHFIGLRRTGRGGSQTPGRGGAVKLRGQTTSFIIDVNDRGERSELSGAVKNQSQSRSRANGRVYSITNLYQPKPRERLFFLRSKLAKVQPLKALPPFGKLPHNFTALARAFLTA